MFEILRVNIIKKRESYIIIEKIGKEIFNLFEKNNSFPILATKRQECEHPELSFHINRMLEEYLRFRDKLIARESESAEYRFIYDLLVKISIIFHDLGKLNGFFQWKMDQGDFIKIADGDRLRIEKNWSYHMGISAFLAYYYCIDLKRKLSNFSDKSDDNAKFL
ncbi:MAG: hypothetical protein ACTSRP_25995, partial [Candidatus Helarchaeota archaeon]